MGANVVSSKRLTNNFRTRQEWFPKLTGGRAKKKRDEEWRKKWIVFTFQKEELLGPFLGLLGIEKPEDAKVASGDFCEINGSTVSSLSFLNPVTGLEETICLSPQPAVPTVDEVPPIEFLILLKDKLCLSDKARYRALRQLYKSLPSFHAISQAIGEHSADIHVKETPCGKGVQISFKDNLSKKLKALLKADPSISRKIQVKFSGDWTWVGKRLHVVNITYTILNEGRKAMGERGNYCLAILKVAEDYHSLEESLVDLVTEMKA